jgi:3-oxoadipate enol-lactonase
MWLPTRIVSHPAVQVHGTGPPVTVFAGGLGAAIAETRVLGSGVAGARVFFDFRGHGAAGDPADGDWSYAALTGDLREVADAYGATRALGVSMGAAALLGVLADTPERFERVAFYLPAILDTPRGSVPERDVRGLSPDAVAGLLRALAETSPIPDRTVLARVTVPALVLAHEGDPTHPAAIARDLAAALPDATLHVFPGPSLASYRREMRSLVSGFLG